MKHTGPFTLHEVDIPIREWGEDILFVMPNSEDSIGTKKEIAFAEEHNVEVRYL